MPPTFAENRAKLVNSRQFLAKIWLLPPHFWVLTPHFSVASEGPVIYIQRLLIILPYHELEIPASHVFLSTDTQLPGTSMAEAKMPIDILLTLASLIAVGVRLLIFELFSSPYSLIRYPTLIRFWIFHDFSITIFKN